MQQQQESGWVYVARSVDCTVIKIGYSANPASRIRGLRYEGKPFVAIGCMRGDTGVEAEITQRFSAFLLPSPNGGPTRDYFAWNEGILEYLNSLPLEPVAPTKILNRLDDEDFATIRVKVAVKRRLEAEQYSRKASGARITLSALIDELMDEAWQRRKQEAA